MRDKGGKTSVSHNDATSRIYLTLAQVPFGHVVTYGGLAELAGLPRAARLVGNTLRNLPADTRLPWHRVINASGRISLPEPRAQVQRKRLEKEGITLLNGRVDLHRYRWPQESD
ncbi:MULTISPECIES: MGMT family protein [Microbulbifer]|uniref:MGMT family protein n=1 Tax=Microbulbifer celer TaxID=435905 RepID=A0ABW3U2F0_9GAMM|nr:MULTISPECIES: MGMT family protein [Microbulbifer]UFN58204.1 MGMT family protein [Microbulbifer celer]